MKSCIICEENEAKFCVRGTSECYCEACAVEYFSDLDMLQKIGEEDTGGIVKEKTGFSEEDNDEL